MLYLLADTCLHACYVYEFLYNVEQESFEYLPIAYSLTLVLCGLAGVVLQERPTALALLSVPLVRQHTEDLLAKHSLVYPPMASPSAQPRPPSTPALKPRQLSARPPERKLRAKSVRKSAGNPVQVTDRN